MEDWPGTGGKAGFAEGCLEDGKGKVLLGGSHTLRLLGLRAEGFMTYPTTKEHLARDQRTAKVEARRVKRQHGHVHFNIDKWLVLLVAWSPTTLTNRSSIKKDNIKWPGLSKRLAAL